MKYKKFHILIAIECLILLLLLPGCFRRAEEVIHLEHSQFQRTETENGEEYLSQEMTLSPGVYRIHVSSHMETQEQKIYLKMNSGSATFHALRGNEVSICAGQEEIDFEVYIIDKLKSAYIRCYGLNGLDENFLNTVDVIKTNSGCRMLFFILLILFMVIDLLIWWRKKLIKGEASRQQLVIICGLAATVFCVYFPYLADYFYKDGLTSFYLFRIENLKSNILNGSFQPVCFQNYLLNEHGDNLLLLGGNLFFYFPAVMRIIGFPLMTAYKALVFMMIIVAAGISYFSFYKMIKDRYVALFGTMSYLLVPYYIFSLYNRGAINECLAMAFIPLICCGMYSLYTESKDNHSYKFYKWYIIIGMSAVLQSYIILTVFIIAFMILTGILFWKRTIQKETRIQILEAAGITFALNSMLLQPVLYMISSDDFSMGSMIDSGMKNGGLHFAETLQLLPNRGGTLSELDVMGVYNSEPIQLGIGLVAAFLLYIVFLLYKNEKVKASEGIFGGFGCVTFLLCLNWRLWDALQIKSVLEDITPSLLMLTMIFGSIFLLFVLLRWREEDVKWFRTGATFILAVTIGSAIYQVNDISFNSSPVYLYTAENINNDFAMAAENLLCKEWMQDKGYLFFHITEGISFITVIAIIVFVIWSYSKKKKENAYERKFDSSKGS